MVANYDEFSWVLGLADWDLVCRHFTHVCTKADYDIGFQCCIQGILNHLRILLLGVVNSTVV